MEDKLYNLEINQVTIKSKITKLQEDLKNNEAIITTLGNQLSDFSKSSINCRVSHESIQIPTCSMTTDDALEFVNSPVTSGFSHKLSGDNELNKKVMEKSLPDDDIFIIFEKITKVKDKSEINIKISRKENVICKHFDSGFCKFRKQCKFLHICRQFISGVCVSYKCIFDHVDLCSVLSCIDKSCTFAHASSGLERRFKTQRFLERRRKYSRPPLPLFVFHSTFSLIPLHTRYRAVYHRNPSLKTILRLKYLRVPSQSNHQNHFTQFGPSLTPPPLTHIPPKNPLPFDSFLLHASKKLPTGSGLHPLFAETNPTPPLSDTPHLTSLPQHHLAPPNPHIKITPNLTYSQITRKPFSLPLHFIPPGYPTSMTLV